MNDVETLPNARDDGKIDTVTAWTFDDEYPLSVLLSRNLDGIMTNRPALLRERYGVWSEQ